MKLRPKILLGIAILIAIFSAFIITNQSSKADTLKLTASENKFNLNFQIADRNKNNFEKVITKLGLPKGIVDGVTFELDPQTATRMSFITPIEAEVDARSNQISLTGSIDYKPNVPVFKAESIKVPKSTAFALFGTNLNYTLLGKFNFNQEELKLFEADQPEYLIIFPPKEIALITKSEFDPKDLDELDSESSNIYLLKAAPKNSEDEIQTLLLVKVNDFNIITTSQDAANEILKSQNSDGENLNFTSASNDPSSFILLFRNKENNLSTETLSTFIKATGSSLNGQKVTEMLNRIDEAHFTLKRGIFSALIKFE